MAEFPAFHSYEFYRFIPASSPAPVAESPPGLTGCDISYEIREASSSSTQGVSSTTQPTAAATPEEEDPQHKLGTIHETWELSSVQWSGTQVSPILNMASVGTQTTSRACHDIETDGPEAPMHPPERQDQIGGHDMGASTPQPSDSNSVRRRLSYLIRGQKTDGGYFPGTFLDADGKPVATTQETRPTTSWSDGELTPVSYPLPRTESPAAILSPHAGDNAASGGANEEVTSDDIAELRNYLENIPELRNIPEHRNTPQASAPPIPTGGEFNIATPQTLPYATAVHQPDAIAPVAVDGYVAVPDPYFRYGAQVRPKLENANRMHDEIYNAIWKAIPTMTPPHDLSQCVLLNQIRSNEDRALWSPVFNVPPECIIQVVPDFFVDEWMKERSDTPRLDIVCLLCDGQRVRYHPRGYLIPSWLPDPPAVLNRRSYTLKAKRNR